MIGIDLKNHFSLTSSVHIRELFDPILKSIGITYFNYIKIYKDDCSRELLTNNPEWIDHFYKNALFNTIGAVDIEHRFPKGYFLWSELDYKDPIYLQGRDFFNIDNGITFIMKREKVTHLYIFASYKENKNINTFYLYNIDLLQRFIHYFNDSAEFLIKEVEKHPIFLPTREIKKCAAGNNKITEFSKIKDKFLCSTNINRYFLKNVSEKLYLTKKQAECARLYVKGFTSKDIANEMGISHRTVEVYLLTIKNKLQKEFKKHLTKTQMIKILLDSNI